MARTFKYDKQDQQTKGYSQTSKKAKLSKQQAGRLEKQALRGMAE